MTLWPSVIVGHVRRVRLVNLLFLSDLFSCFLHASPLVVQRDAEPWPGRILSVGELGKLEVVVALCSNVLRCRLQLSAVAGQCSLLPSRWVIPIAAQQATRGSSLFLARNCRHERALRERHPCALQCRPPRWCSDESATSSYDAVARF
jgi:hypothetical protein